jgi:hypothetical protein
MPNRLHHPARKGFGLFGAFNSNDAANSAHPELTLNDSGVPWLREYCGAKNKVTPEEIYLRSIAGCHRAMLSWCFGTGIGWGIWASLGNRYSIPISNQRKALFTKL